MGAAVELIIAASNEMHYGPLSAVLISIAAGLIIYFAASLIFKNDSANILKNIIAKKH